MSGNDVYTIHENGAIDFTTGADPIASDIAVTWDHWRSLRATKEAEFAEVRQYIVATDTSKTSNSTLPWKNKTTRPKLTQIRDNLHANYMAIMLPNDGWLEWEGFDESAETQDKRKAVLSYMKNKINKSNLREQLEMLTWDYIDYGNAFGLVSYEQKYTIDSETDERIPVYIGPKLVRISPFDIVFNPTSSSFAAAPKIIRSTTTLGDLVQSMSNNPELGYDEEVINRIKQTRQVFQGLTGDQQAKSTGFKADGFSSFQNYFSSDIVEILEFRGTYYDSEKDKLYEDYIITIIDRKYILRKIPNKSWIGSSQIHHIGWRQRSDNLWAMGPLDNLVGMQYRVDHLENLKADVFDLIAHPVIHVAGESDDFEYGPGTKISTEADTVIRMLVPDTTALNADTQIQILENEMEEMAGSPKFASGFRTPGEKTKYEVQVLESGANRIFVAKTSRFERFFLEPIVNDFFEISRRNFGDGDVVRSLDQDTGVVEFLEITKEDIKANGKLSPIAARHFADDARWVQDVSQFLAGPGQHPLVAPHISGKVIARKLADKIGISEAFAENVALQEQAETTKLASRLQEQLQNSSATPTEPQPTDFTQEGDSTDGGQATAEPTS